MEIRITNKRNKNKKLKLLITVGKYLAFLFLGGCLLILAVFIYYTWNLPQPEKFTETP
jgi:hypothetical protein